LVERLKEADESVIGYSNLVKGGTIQLFVHYSGLRSPVPATRLSDGTVRYLCLLAILCHPDPPPLVCLEEPELGLHPDLQSRLADLLIEASHRMQLIVTTHSDILIDGLTDVPEAVVVCEKRNGSTNMSRRTKADLAQWLKDYGLGQLWRRGEIGGNRW
jgi:predicted ATPase